MPLSTRQHQSRVSRPSSLPIRSLDAARNTDSSLTDLSSSDDHDDYIGPSAAPKTALVHKPGSAIPKPPLIRFKNLENHRSTGPELLKYKPAPQQPDDDDTFQFIDAYKRKVLAKVTHKHTNSRSKCRSSRLGSKIDPKANNDDQCSACDLAGSLLCCERCPRAFHRLCLNPPLDYHQVPAGEWYCHECALLMHWRAPPPPNPTLPSSPILRFSLPPPVLLPGPGLPPSLPALPWIEYRSATSMLGAMAAKSRPPYPSLGTTNGTVRLRDSGLGCMTGDERGNGYGLNGMNGCILDPEHDRLSCSPPMSPPESGRRSKRYSALVSRTQTQKILRLHSSPTSLDPPPSPVSKKRQRTTIPYTCTLPPPEIPTKLHPPSAIGLTIRSVFKKLVTHTQRANPRAFRLDEAGDRSSILSAYTNISSDRDGDLIIVTVPAVPNSAAALTCANSTHGSKPGYASKKPPPVPYVTCFACMEHLYKKPWLACHWCPCAFHLDCLPIPPTIPPPMRSGWKCPLHADIDAGLCAVERMRMFVNMKGTSRALLL